MSVSYILPGSHVSYSIHPQAVRPSQIVGRGEKDAEYADGENIITLPGVFLRKANVECRERPAQK